MHPLQVEQLPNSARFNGCDALVLLRMASPAAGRQAALPLFTLAGQRWSQAGPKEWDK